MIKYILLVNRQGQPRISQYYESFDKDERLLMERDVVKKCLSRDEKHVIISYFKITDFFYFFSVLVGKYFCIAIHPERTLRYKFVDTIYDLRKKTYPH